MGFSNNRLLDYEQRRHLLVLGDTKMQTNITFAQASKVKPLMHGFGLIELMITVAIIGIMSSMAIPAFSEWVADTKTRTMAEVFQNNIRLAQTEALRRGRQVQFFLTTAAPAMNVATATNGKNWGIQSMTLTNKNTAEEFIQGGNLSAGNSSITVNASSAVIQFNSIGRVSNVNQPITIQLTNSKGDRKMNITVSLAGGVRMCDPEKSRASYADGC